MSKKKKQTQQLEDNFDSIQESLNRGEQFIEKNKNYLTYGVLAVLIIAAIIMGYQKYIQAPKEASSIRNAYVAQQYFEKDSFQLALDGDGEFPGFIEIIENYGSTKLGNTANYYAGVSYFKLGKYDEAIDYLSNFSSSDKMLSPISKGLIGDAYAEKGDFAKAAEYYDKAVKDNDNELTTPVYLMKLGRAYEKEAKWDKALKAYKRIENEYKNTEEGRKIKKFITRAELNM